MSAALSPTPLRLTISDELDGERLDRALAALLPALSRARLQRLIGAARVHLDGKIAAKSSLAVARGQQVVIELPDEPTTPSPRPQAIPLAVLYEDDDLVIVDKPAGLVVHAGAGRHDGTLVNALLHRYGESLSRRGGADRPGIVHRLDKGTTGVIAVARNDAAHTALAAQFAARTVAKEYAAVVYGCPRQGSGLIDIPIGRDRTDRTRISTRTDRPRDATTRWELAEDLSGLALLRVLPRTGRMHQVRAHLAAVHHPCVGDDRYAGARWKSVPDRRTRRLARDFPRPALHARRLELDHPRSGERMAFEAPLPADLEALLAALRRR